jgi:hypothetical protein
MIGALRYFNPRYWASRYWPKIGAEPAAYGPIECMQPGDVFRIPRHVGDRYQLARQLGDTLRIPRHVGDVFRC